MATDDELSREILLKGYPICPGIAIGRPFYFATPDEHVPEFSVPKEQIDGEIARYYKALKNSRRDLLSMQKLLQHEGGSEAAAILGSHLEMTHDPLITTRIEEAIRHRGKNTEYVFKSVIGEYEEKFLKISNKFFRERLSDFQDISRRIIGHLRQHERCSLSKLQMRSIVFAHELSPSDTAEANTEQIDAFVTRSGAETSHVAIMARARGIPFVSNVDFPDLTLSIPPRVIVDGQSGHVIINPRKETEAHYSHERKKLKVQVKGLQKRGQGEAETTDGERVRLTANLELFEQVSTLADYGGEGIGLFRSEYLFLLKDTFPTENEQFKAYRHLVEGVSGYSAVIRTFDIGGDKLGNYHFTRNEKNPYLGCRAIRLMLREQGIFKTQIRAILRASAFGEASLLLPMVTDLSELLSAKAIIEEVKQELSAAGVPFSRSIRLGCMIEVPSAALITDILAAECDFFSIGTNDLVQYLLAVDRSNQNMSYLYTPAHPSVVRLIQSIVKECAKVSKPVSLCGEIAANARFLPLLLGLGIREFSVSAPQIPKVKNVIRNLSIQGAKKLTKQALKCRSAEELDQLLEKAYQKLAPHL